MCVSVIKKVMSVSSKTAVMEDGRTVRLDGVNRVSAGDYLEVYADLAVAKIADYSVKKGKGRRDV